MKQKIKSKWKLLINSGSAKAGMIFEWNTEENAYTTKELPWFLTPLVPFNMITKKKLFERL